MGNRVYCTVSGQDQTKTFYLHWNGGLDTFCPLVEVLFQNEISKVSDFESFLKYLGLRAESQVETDRTLREENGHYSIDLVDRKFSHALEAFPIFLEVLDRKQTFETYIRDFIREDYRDKVRKEYWEGILEAGREFFQK